MQTTTTSAPQAGGSLFGSTANNPSFSVGGNLFGASPANNSIAQNGSNLFGSTVNNPAPQAGGGLFGSTTNPPAPQTAGSLFGSTAPASSTPSTLFGTPNQTASTQPAPTNLFGNLNQNASSGNLFGSTNTNPSSTGTGSLFRAPQAGGSLFGSTAPASSTPSTLFGTSNQTASTQAAPTNLFGNSSQNASSGNLFGSTNTNPNSTGTGSLFRAPQAGGSLFGSTAPGSSSPSTLFGTSNQASSTQAAPANPFGNLSQNASSGNLFGSSNANPSSTGGNLFGSSQTNPLNLSASFGNKSSSVPATPVSFGVGNGVSQSNPVFTRTTRFNDLPDDAKKQLEMLDTMIQTQCRHSDNLKAMQLGTEITEGTSLLRQATSEMHAASASVTTSSNLLDSIRQAIDTDVTDLLKLAAIVDAHLTQRLAVGAHNPLESLPNPIKFQQEFFSAKCAEMEDRVKRYRQTIEFVELQLKGLFDRPSPASIVPALKAQYSTFMALADKVAQLNASLISLKEEYREIWRHQTGSVRDPFAEVDQVFGVGGGSLMHFQPC